MNTVFPRSIYPVRGPHPGNTRLVVSGWSLAEAGGVCDTNSDAISGASVTEVKFDRNEEGVGSCCIES